MGRAQAKMEALAPEEDAGASLQQGHASGRDSEGDHDKLQPREHSEVYR